MSSLREIENAVSALERGSMLYMTHATLRWLELDMGRFLAKAGFNPGQPRIPRGQPGGGQWTGGGGVGSTARAAAPTPGPHGWGDVGTLKDHIERHGKDFGISSKTEYAWRAQEFYRHAQQNKLPMTEYPKGGKIAVYDPKTNTFGVYNRNGTTASFYKPPEGRAYFERLTKTQLGRGGRTINALPPAAESFGGRGGLGGPLRLDPLKPKLY